jgi:hypothetical protein
MPTLEELRKMLEHGGRKIVTQLEEKSSLEVLSEDIEKDRVRFPNLIFSPVEITMETGSGNNGKIFQSTDYEANWSEIGDLASETSDGNAIAGMGTCPVEIARAAKRIYKTAEDRVCDQSLRYEEIGLLAIEEDTGDVYQLKGWNRRQLNLNCCRRGLIVASHRQICWRMEGNRDVWNESGCDEF